jgi:hypothetical protein
MSTCWEILGAFQLGGQQLPDEEERCCLAAVEQQPNNTNPYLHILTNILPTFVECAQIPRASILLEKCFVY